MIPMFWIDHCLFESDQGGEDFLVATELDDAVAEEGGFLESRFDN